MAKINRLKIWAPIVCTVVAGAVAFPAVAQAAETIPPSSPGPVAVSDGPGPSNLRAPFLLERGQTIPVSVDGCGAKGGEVWADQNAFTPGNTKWLPNKRIELPSNGRVYVQVSRNAPYGTTDFYAKCNDSSVIASSYFMINWPK
ncbi:hypothetical protein [Streptomyces sp. NPDC056492]|uniref:hypothetical protein n=1 Tax=unclassified Streptomyces TaxID=2593676 RepID=UPI0036ADD117